MLWPMNVETPKVVYLTEFKYPKKQEFYEKWWFKSLLNCGAIIIKCIPPLKRYILSTASGKLGLCNRLYREKKYDKVLEICKDSLIKYRDKTDWLGHYDWWEFMRYAVYAADALKDGNQKSYLISLAKDGISPFKGFSVATSYCYFSRWKYSEGDYDNAIQYAETAEKADDKSADAKFILGWYDLFIKNVDPLEHFKAAIKNDIKYLATIINEPAIKDFPHIIAELKKLKLINSKRGH
jgi:tetratricopeptide (TPR) repeat protein